MCLIRNFMTFAPEQFFFFFYEMKDDEGGKSCCTYENRFV